MKKKAEEALDETAKYCFIFLYLYRIFPFSKADISGGPDELKIKYMRMQSNMKWQIFENVLYSNITETVLSIFLNCGRDLHCCLLSLGARCRSLILSAKLIFFLNSVLTAAITTLSCSLLYNYGCLTRCAV